MRDNSWLAQRMLTLHDEYFPDVPVRNVLYVRFGRISRTRLGSIIARPRKGYRLPVTYISINSLFKDEAVPDYVIDGTLLHEFAHYTHGFHSPLEQRYKFPHKGDIVNKEIRQRGGTAILELQEAWIKREYPTFLRKHRLI